MKRIIISLSLVFLLAACHNDPPVVTPPASSDNELDEHLINANRTISLAEEHTIDEYVKRHEWEDVVTVGDGVRMWEYERGEGPEIQYEEEIEVEYIMGVINGKRFFGPVDETYVVGHRENIIGLDQAIIHMRHGSKAYVVIPSPVGYGMVGDGGKITTRATLVMSVEVK